MCCVLHDPPPHLFPPSGHHASSSAPRHAARRTAPPHTNTRGLALPSGTPDSARTRPPPSPVSVMRPTRLLPLLLLSAALAGCSATREAAAPTPPVAVADAPSETAPKAESTEPAAPEQP